MRRIGILLCAAALAAGCATKRPAFPSNTPRGLCSWERVVSIPAGTSVEVMTGPSTPGTRGGFVSANETRITLEVNGMADETLRRSVMRVARNSSKPYVRFVRFGALYGAMFGSGLLIEAGGAPPGGAALFAAAWAAIGLTGGAVAAWKVADRKVVYDVQSWTGGYP